MSLLTTSLRCLAAGAALLLLMPGVQAALPQSDFPLHETLLLDITQRIEKKEIDVTVFVTPESCTPPSGATELQEMIALTNDALIRSWACRAYTIAANNPKEELAFIPTSPALKRPSIVETVQALPASATGRRYVALVDWKFIDLTASKRCASSCTAGVLMSSEVVVYDRAAGKTIWHSIQTQRADMRSASYAEDKLVGLGPNPINATLTRLGYEKDTVDAEMGGVRRTTALALASQPGQAATALNTKANLIIFNRLPQATSSSTYFADGLQFFSLRADHLMGSAKKTDYTSSSNTHTALELAPGRYELAWQDAPVTIDIKSDGAPVYLSFKRGFLNKLSVSELDGQQALDLAQDSINALVPEVTPTAHLRNLRKLQWTQP